MNFLKLLKTCGQRFKCYELSMKTWLPRSSLENWLKELKTKSNKSTPRMLKELEDIQQELITNPFG